jgi:CheY-like chemotaxis protein
MWLIAEDELDIRNLVEMLCRTWGYDTLIFEDGQAVWDWLDAVESGHYTSDLPQMALMDIRMPGKRGDEIAERIRTIPELAGMTVVLMTAFSLSDSQRSALMAVGADMVIGKPLPDFDQLYAILHEVMYSRMQN